MPIAAVIFDFDGVLADTERLHLRAFQDVLAAHGRSLAERDYFERFLGYCDRDLFVEVARESGWRLDAAAIDALLTGKAERYRHHLTAGSALYDTAAGCVQCLAARFPLAIASGSLRLEIEDILAAASLRHPFRVIVGADDVSSGKPSPEPYAEAAARLGVDPRQTVAIEDSRWGLDSARAAGLRTIGITTTYPAAALAVADVVVDSLAEVTPDLIDRLG